MNELAPPSSTRSDPASDRLSSEAAAHAPGNHLVRSHTTMTIHVLVLSVVLFQLASSQFMERPSPGDDPSWQFTWHQYIGLFGLAVVALFWVWTMVRRGETRLDRLLPWFSRARLRDVMTDIGHQARRLSRGRAPDDEDGALAAATHGLGLLTVTAMTITGAVWYFLQGSPVARTSMDVHLVVANLMWAYLFAHAGIAVLHALLGSDIFARMFWFGRRRRLFRSPVKG